MFGLMDNIGYAIAKASMIGMAKSLTVGRKDANINVNCIAPNAMTRLAARTEEEQARRPPPPPSDGPGKRRPHGRLPGPRVLPGQRRDLRGRRRPVRPAVRRGHPRLPAPRPDRRDVDDVAANWAAINDETGYYVPSDLMDWSATTCPTCAGRRRDRHPFREDGAGHRRLVGDRPEHRPRPRGRGGAESRWSPAGPSG